MTSIRGRVALVTGGGDGIGRALALALAGEGASVAVADIRSGPAQGVVEEIRQAGGTACWVECDVSDRQSVEKMRTTVEASLGNVSLLFANAGATSFDTLVEITDANLDWIIQVNFMGVVNCVKTFLPGMVERGEGGHLCATASIAGLLPAWAPNHALYSGAKLGVLGFMMNLDLELEEYHIGTTVYCPGGVVTGMTVPGQNSTYRPSRFGGSFDAKIVLRGKFRGGLRTEEIKAYPPERIAPMVLRAVQNNRAIVFDHSEHRSIFQKTYVDEVMSAFDDVDEYLAQENWQE